ncbi:MAG: aldo/keto reductase [Candidatus Schekmanbacteria bacterium]|nr:MAG: aldo/keto reductase [Candidatus Schekmanbacteria bacterium]
MEYRELGKSGIKVSTIGLGTWAIGGMFWGKTDDAEAIKAIEASIDYGINLIDTAPAYGTGHSEKLVGKAIKGKREKVVVATKCGLDRKKGFIIDLKPKKIRQDLEESLMFLNTDYIDLYQCHWPDPKTPIEDTMEELLKMQSEGKIRAIGVSNFDLELLKKTVSIAPIASLQPHYSLLKRDIEKDILPFCRQNNIGILAYGSLGSGILTGKYKKRPSFAGNDARSFFYPFYKEPYWSKTQELLKEMEKIANKYDRPLSHIAINWIRQQEGITSALVGAKNASQAKSNAQAAEWQLSADELAYLSEKATAIF